MALPVTDTEPGIMQANLGSAAALALILLAGPSAAQTTAVTEDPVAATVDGGTVHRSEVEAMVRQLPQQYQQMPLEAIYPALLDRAIDSHLLAGEAERRGLGDEEAVQDELARARAAVLRNALVEQAIAEATSEEALRQRFEEQKESGDLSKDEVHASHILLSSEDEAKEVIAELQAGADFATLAKDRSIGPSAPKGGDLGYFTRDQMVPEFAEAAFAMEAGETSTEPVKTQFGYHVINVVDRRQAEASFEESAAKLYEELAREVVSNLVAGLREGAEIERFNLDGTPMPAQ
jgi:peptidyl-prolyl cis-trans isomerase C